MTASSLHPAVGVASVDAAVDLLRDHGLRMTMARRIILETLFEAEGPLSAEAVAGGLGERQRRLELTSVYRNLEAFERLGLVRHVHLGHGAGLYALSRELETEFLLCERCEAVLTVPPSALDGVRAAVRQATGLHAQFSHFPIVGLCERCAATELDGEDGHEHGR